MAKNNEPDPWHVAVTRIVISLLLLIAGFAILTAPNIVINSEMSVGVQNFAAGWIGAVVGYWLS